MDSVLTTVNALVAFIGLVMGSGGYMAWKNWKDNKDKELENKIREDKLLPTEIKLKDQVYYEKIIIRLEKELDKYDKRYDEAIEEIDGLRKELHEVNVRCDHFEREIKRWQYDYQILKNEKDITDNKLADCQGENALLKSNVAPGNA